ncbi:MAG: hypothetical protein U0T56_00850 [Ferruginibacter sp.]
MGQGILFPRAATIEKLDSNSTEEKEVFEIIDVEEKEIDDPITAEKSDATN